MSTGSSPYLDKPTSSSSNGAAAAAFPTPPPDSFGHIDESAGEVIIIIGFVAIIAIAMFAGLCSYKCTNGEDEDYLHNRGKTGASVRSLFSLLMLSTIRDRLARCRREELRRKQDWASSNSSSGNRTEGIAANLSGFAMIDEFIDADSETEAQKERESENEEESSTAEEYSVRNSVEDILI